MKRVILSLVLTIVCTVLVSSNVFAQYTSPSYKADETFFGAGGELDASSGHYKAQSSAGALGVGYGSLPTSIGFIQGNQNFDSASGTTLTSSFSSNVVAGHMLIVAVGGGTNGSYPVTDSLGNSYTKANDVYDTSLGNYYSAIYYTVSGSSGADTVTVTPSVTADFRRILIQEYSGVSALDVTSSNTGTGSTVDSGSATTHYPNELIFGWMIGYDGVTSAGSGYTLRETAGSESTMDKSVTTTGNYNVTAPNSTSNFWSGLMATFYYSSSAAQAYAGFLTPNEPFLEMTVNTSVADLGVLDSSAAKTANASFNVRDYTSSGYTVVTMSQPPTTGSGQVLNPMTTLGSSTPGTEQFGMNLVANTSPASFGSDPSKQPDSTFASGEAAPGYSTANQYKYNTGDVIADTNQSGWGQTNYTISYIGNISPITKAGQYSMVHDLVVVPTY